MPDLVAERYEVVRTVSEGRRATVLQAIDRLHDRFVALKCFPVTDTDRDDLLAEARLLISMSPHPGLPVVRGDFFTDEGSTYVVVLNWIDGADLQAVVEQDGDPGLALDEVIETLTPVAAALDHLHAHSPPIIHGDVKPANLIRTSGGSVVLVDFDIAGADSARGRVGTVGYVAPEVAAGAKPGPAADVYGLAATAVALLNGHPADAVPPAFPGLDPDVHAQIARVLRGAMSVDPARRPRSAGRLVASLRRAQRDEQPSGVVALLATEVVDSSLLWDKDAPGMRAAMGRLRSVRDEVLDALGGRVITSMNEGDRMLAVFREASAAAEAALTLHDQTARQHFPPGIDIRLRAAIAVGEATYADGVYSGAVVDKVVQLRAAAAPGGTITSESTAELLVGLVGHDVSLVSVAEVSDGPLQGRRLFALTRPGFEHVAAVVTSAPPTEAPRTPVDLAAEGKIVLESLQHTSTLVALSICGLALIFVVVLAPVFGGGAIGVAIAAASAVGAIASFVRRYVAAQRTRAIEEAAARRAEEAERQERLASVRRDDTRRQLELGFAQVDSDSADVGANVLRGLADEFEAIGDVLRRTRDRPQQSLTARLPDLAEEAYEAGISALSKALELFEFADGPQHRRLEDQARDIDARLEEDAYDDDRSRSRDEERQASHARLLARHDESRQRGTDLLFEAERCTAALAATRIELASSRAGDAQANAGSVVETLQDAIACVRAVEDELRSIGY